MRRADDSRDIGCRNRLHFVLFQIYEVFYIALRSFDRGKIESRHRKSRLHGIGADIFDDFYVHALIFDHAFLADILPARLKLRLYKADSTAGRLLKAAKAQAGYISEI